MWLVLVRNKSFYRIQRQEVATWKISCFSAGKNVCGRWKQRQKHIHDTFWNVVACWHFFFEYWHPEVCFIVGFVACGAGRLEESWNVGLVPVRYIARKRVEDTLSYDDLYVTSLSPKTIVYKVCWEKKSRVFVGLCGEGCTWNAALGCLEYIFWRSTCFLKEVFGCLTGYDMMTLTAWNWMINHRLHRVRGQTCQSKWYFIRGALEDLANYYLDGGFFGNIFTTIWGNDAIWRAFCNWVETTN